MHPPFYQRTAVRGFRERGHLAPFPLPSAAAAEYIFFRYTRRKDIVRGGRSEPLRDVLTCTSSFAIETGSRLYRTLIDHNRSRSGEGFPPGAEGTPGCPSASGQKTPSGPAGGGGQLRSGLFQPMELQIIESAMCHRGNQLPWYQKQDVTGQQTGGHGNNGGGTSAGIRDATAGK